MDGVISDVGETGENGGAARHAARLAHLDHQLNKISLHYKHADEGESDLGLVCTEGKSLKFVQTHEHVQYMSYHGRIS